MNTFVKLIIAAIVGGVVGGSVPTIAGNSWEQILATAVAGIVIALFHLYVPSPLTK